MNLEDAEDRRAALTVPCRDCHVDAGAECVRIADGQPLEHAPAHVRRIADAGIVHAPLDTRELRAP